MTLVRRIVLCLLIAALALPVEASAESVAQLKARLDDLKRQTRDAGDAYSSAHWKLDETEVALGKTQRQLKTTEKRLSAAKRKLNQRANRMYRQEAFGPIQFLMGARSFEDLVTRADYLARIGSADAKVVYDVKILRRKLIAQRMRLAKQRKIRAADVRKLRARRDRLDGRLRSLEGQFRRVKRALDAARSSRPLASGTISAPGPNGMVFPVVGSYYYADTWGASRSGGRRRHKGTDIMSPRGTPCVAVLSGTITSKEGGLGGKTIWLHSDNGWTFYYAHLDSWAIRSGRVSAGQVVGYVGSTGNASASAPHLHFEIHPGGGGAVNPYPYLRSME